MGVENPITKYPLLWRLVTQEVTAGFRVCSSTILNLTYASDVVIVDIYVWTTESAAAKQAEDYKILS